MWAERECTFTNFQGRVQRTNKPFEPRGLAIPEWQVWKILAGKLGHESAFKTPQEIFNHIGNSVEAFKGLTWDSLGSSGKMLNGLSEPAYKKVQTSKPLPAY